MWDKLSIMFEKHFNIYMLMLLIILLSGAHATMIHWNRPLEIIHWAENMISAGVATLFRELGVSKAEKTEKAETKQS